MIRISNRQIIHSVTGVLHEMSPYFKVPGMDAIINGVLTALYDRADDKTKARMSEKDGIYNWELFDFEDEKDFYDFLKKVLFDIPEFKRLNVSPAKQKEGVTFESEKDVIYFYGRGIETSNQEHEFVDIWAAVQNIVANIIHCYKEDHDCFLCKYAERYGSCEPGNNDFCNYCINNLSDKCKVRSYHEPHPWSLLPINSEEYKKLVAEGKIKGME